MAIPLLFGKPIHLWLGILLFLLVVIQIGIAKKIIKIPFKWHRVGGYVILGLAFIHGLIGLGLNLGFFTY